MDAPRPQLDDEHRVDTMQGVGQTPRGCYAPRKVSRRSVALITMTHTHASPAPSPLLLAFEWGERSWKLGFSMGPGQRPRLRQIPAGAVSVLRDEIARAKARLALPCDAPVISCYEAGRDGFWWHRYLTAQGIVNHVSDSASIEVDRHALRGR